MSHAEKERSRSPTRRQSKDVKKQTDDGENKRDEPKGGLGPYFVSALKLRC
jgi:hypothetical protein